MVRTSRLEAVLEELSSVSLASPGTSVGGGLEGINLQGSSPSTVNAASTHSDNTSISSVTPMRESGTGSFSQPHRGESPYAFNTLLHQASTAASSQSQGGKKYRLWCTPADTRNVCMGLIGQGASFCTIVGCSKNHRSQKVHPGIPQEAYVARTSESAFVEPMTKTTYLTRDLLASWKELYVTLEEWTSLFSLVTSQEEEAKESGGVKFSLQDIKVKDEEESSALAFKTPRKRKFTSPSSPALLIPIFERVIEEDENRSFTLEAVKAYINKLDERSMQLRGVLTDWTSRSDRTYNEALSFYHSTDLKLNKLFGAIGNKPTSLDAQFDAPNVWLTIANVAEEVSKASDIQHQALNSMKSEILEVAEEAKQHSKTFELQSRISDLESFVIQSARKLNQNIAVVSRSIETSSQRVDTPGPSIDLLQRMEKMERELVAIKSINDEAAIKYSNLGFKSQRESDAWFETNLPNDDYGLLMDFNMVCEHVFIQLAGQKILTNLNQVHKMKLSNNNQAVALTSFETRIPKVFCGEGKGVGIVREGESYFKTIKTWEDWDTPNDGFRDQIKRELTVFQIGHQELLNVDLEPLSLYHTLCSKTLTDSIGWAHKFIKFIDDTYREYSRAKYSTKKAWHVATKLAVALMNYVAKPRNVVQNSFRISNNLAVAKSVSFATLRSLDLMLKIEILDFKNSPIVTSELAKFLALNSSMESLEVLQRSVKTMSDDVSKAVKDAGAATKSASTIGNSVDGVKNELKGLSKRLKTLESKNQ